MYHSAGRGLFRRGVICFPHWMQTTRTAETTRKNFENNSLLNTINSSISRNHENHKMKFLKETPSTKQPPFYDPSISLLSGMIDACFKDNSIKPLQLPLLLFITSFGPQQAGLQGPQSKGADGVAFAGNGLRVKTQRANTSENFSEESNLPRRFRRYPEIL